MLDIEVCARLSLERRRKTAWDDADEPASDERSERKRLKERKVWAEEREVGCGSGDEGPSRAREIRRGVGEGWLLRRRSGGEDAPRELLWPMALWERQRLGLRERAKNRWCGGEERGGVGNEGEARGETPLAGVEHAMMTGPARGWPPLPAVLVGHRSRAIYKRGRGPRPAGEMSDDCAALCWPRRPLRRCFSTNPAICLAPCCLRCLLPPHSLTRARGPRAARACARACIARSGSASVPTTTAATSARKKLPTTQAIPPETTPPRRDQPPLPLPLYPPPKPTSSASQAMIPTSHFLHLRSLMRQPLRAAKRNLRLHNFSGSWPPSSHHCTLPISRLPHVCLNPHPKRGIICANMSFDKQWRSCTIVYCAATTTGPAVRGS